MTIKINENTTVREISTQLAEIIDNPMFLEMSGNTQDCIISMFNVVNKFIIENKLDTENDW